MQQTREVHYVSGYRIAQARRNCEFYFGAFFISCELHDSNRVFLIKIKEKIKVKNKNGTVTTESVHDYIDIERYKEFWGPQWKLMYDASVEV